MRNLQKNLNIIWQPPPILPNPPPPPPPFPSILKKSTEGGGGSELCEVSEMKFFNNRYPTFSKSANFSTPPSSNST